MHSPLLNCFIFICKLLTCISILISLNTHHWIRDIDEGRYHGIQSRCYDYGRYCYRHPSIGRVMWFFYIITLLNVIFESLNIILLLCKRTRTPINLVLEELAILFTIIFILPGAFSSLAVFVVVGNDHERSVDWSFILFFLSVILSLIDLICSLVRVVSYCRQNSFRSKVITYTSADQGTVELQA